MVTKDAYLVLEDGSFYKGERFGTDISAHGEVVFNTSMTGYQEMLTDPSYSGQIVMPTYPLIGNYGINPADVESLRIQVAGFVVGEHSLFPSHYSSTGTLQQYLIDEGIPGICHVDTRAIVRKLRSSGVMMGAITADEPSNALLSRLQNMPHYDSFDFVKSVTTPSQYHWEKTTKNVKRRNVVVIDCGLKYNILRIMKHRGCAVSAVPATASSAEILAQRPDGVIVSPGPGDPAMLGYAVETVGRLLGKVPMMGICLGHQIIARALGAKTYKLKFGHRGANHPVKDVETGRIHITAQNHGYAVAAERLPTGLEVSHVNLNDGTVEGLRHSAMPILTIQYHSEGAPGPWDNEYLFDRFLSIIKEVSGK